MRLRLAAVLTLIAAPASAEQLAGGINDLVLERFVIGLSQPTAMEFLPDGRLVILEYGGRIRVRPAAGGALINAGQLPTRIMSIEQGGLGLAVDPLFSTSNRLYFYFSRTNSSDDNRHRIGYATIDPTSSQVDVGNITEILGGLWGPRNHNGGGLRFGPDGMLYIGTGDTGCNCGCGPGQANNYNPTCLTNLQGKILRIGRNGEIPADNPLVNVAQVRACPVSTPRPCQSTAPNGQNLAAPRTEIYNWGFRNAWRFSWDAQTGYLWVGDVGEITWEEITISTGPGQHHGWPFREGTEGQNRNRCTEMTPSATGPCVEPAFAYTHFESPAFSQGSITGGVFSNHCSWPLPYLGQYWFGGYNKGRIWTVTPNGGRDGVDANSRTAIVTGAGGPVHITTGPDGAIYTADIDNGRIYRVAPANPVACDMDAGVPEDTGPAPMDAQPARDAATTPADARIGDALPIGDANPNADATTANRDAGAQTPADTGSNSGGNNNGGRVADDCSCSATQVDSGWNWLWLGGLLFVRRRRHHS